MLEDITQCMVVWDLWFTITTLGVRWLFTINPSLPCLIKGVLNYLWLFYVGRPATEYVQHL